MSLQVVNSAPACAKQPLPKKPQEPLGDLAKRICTEHQAAISGVIHAMAAGDLLIQAQDRVKHGEWEVWVERNCKMSKRTAEVYMRLARNRKDVEAKAQHAADLSMRGALKAIAPPKASGKAAAPKAIATPAAPSRPAYTESSNKTQPHLFALQLWVGMPLEEQQKLLDAISLRGLLKSMPQSWLDSPKYSATLAQLAMLANAK